MNDLNNSGIVIITGAEEGKCSQAGLTKGFLTMFGMEWLISQFGRKIYIDLVFSLKYFKYTHTLVRTRTLTYHRYFGRRTSRGVTEAPRAA